MRSCLLKPIFKRRLSRLKTAYPVLTIAAFMLAAPLPAQNKRPNVILIICDDLNDYVEGFGGHPQARTPNIARLSKSGVAFTQAHCNIPICGPSRASFFTGIYPHNSLCYGFNRWDQHPVLKSSRTIMDHFRANGYHTLGTGKLMHHLVRKEWTDYGNRADYGPFVFDGTERLAHPDVPAPFREIGTVDGSFGPLVHLSGRTNKAGKELSWQTGGWGKVRPLRVNSQENRDRTADELNGDWAVRQLRGLAAGANDKPFFMGVGFIRPHTPLIVPQRFFDMFPLESITLPDIKAGDVEDTHARSVRGIPNNREPGSKRTSDMGLRLFSDLVASYKSKEEALRRFIQAYLASVASVDEQIGRILDVVEKSRLENNTVIILTSDHGWGMGEKDYLYKNSLWQESTRVPLIVRAPGVATAGATSDQPVSLIDLYPTLIDLCGLDSKTKKNNGGHALDGHSLEPLLVDPAAGKWTGPDEVLTALYKWSQNYDPARQSYTLRGRDWRYIRYSNGKEELYHNARDPHEWHNLAGEASQTSRIETFRKKLAARLPEPSSNTQANDKKKDAEAWKNRYFAANPAADTNKDGTLTWVELKAHKARKEAKKPPARKSQ